MGDLSHFVKCDCVSLHFRKDLMSLYLCFYVSHEYRSVKIEVGIQFSFMCLCLV